MLGFMEILQLRFSAVLPQVAAGLLVVGTFWVVARVTGTLVMRLQVHVEDVHKDLISLLADVAGWTLFLIGIITGLGTAGVNVMALVTGLGLVGLAISFAMKDVLSNMVAGVLVLLFRPYSRGDRVRIGTFQGKVSNINLRYTTLLAKGGSILIPNAKAHTEIIVLLTDEEVPVERPSTSNPKGTS